MYANFISNHNIQIVRHKVSFKNQQKTDGYKNTHKTLIIKASIFFTKIIKSSFYIIFKDWSRT